MRGLVVAAIVAIGSHGTAGADQPCVPRLPPGSGLIMSPSHVRVEGAGLSFCSGSSVRGPCWSMDLATHAFAPAEIEPVRGDDEVRCTQDECTLWSERARVNRKEVTFCPGGPDSCRSYPRPIPRGSDHFDVRLLHNRELTLGAASYRKPDSTRREVLLIDLARGKVVRRLQGQDVLVVRGAFVVDRTFYAASGKKLGTVKTAYAPSIDGRFASRHRLGATDLVAFGHAGQAVLVIIDAASAKVRHRIVLPLRPTGREPEDEAGTLGLASTPDGARAYVVAGTPYVSNVLEIDVAAGAVVADVDPPICPR